MLSAWSRRQIRGLGLISLSAQWSFGDAQGIPQEHIPHFALEVFAVMCQSSVVLKHFTSPAVGLSPRNFHQMPHQGIFTNLLN